MELPPPPGRPFTLYPATARSWFLGIAALLIAVPGVMILWKENGPGVGDDLLSYGLIAFGLGAGVYLLRRRKRPILTADADGIVYFPYDDPATSLRHGSQARIAWSDVASITGARTGAPAIVPVMYVTTRDGRRFELPLMMLGLGFEELAERLQAAAPVRLPIDR